MELPTLPYYLTHRNFGLGCHSFNELRSAAINVPAAMTMASLGGVMFVAGAKKSITKEASFTSYATLIAGAILLGVGSTMAASEYPFAKKYFSCFN